jgi:hypothetical protein
MHRALIIIAILATGTATAAELQSSVPETFRGEWNADPADCSSHLSESQLEISATEIAFYESGGPLIAIVTRADNEIALIAEMSGEGETWLLYNQFQISDDGSQLTDITDDGGLVRYRCP